MLKVGRVGDLYRRTKMADLHVGDEVYSVVRKKYFKVSSIKEDGTQVLFDIITHEKRDEELIDASSSDCGLPDAAPGDTCST